METTLALIERSGLQQPDIELTLGTNFSGQQGRIVVPPSVYEVRIEAGPDKGKVIPQFKGLGMPEFVLVGSLLMDQLYCIFEYDVTETNERTERDERRGDGPALLRFKEGGTVLHCCVLVRESNNVTPSSTWAGPALPVTSKGRHSREPGVATASPGFGASGAAQACQICELRCISRERDATGFGNAQPPLGSDPVSGSGHEDWAPEAPPRLVRETRSGPGAGHDWFEYDDDPLGSRFTFFSSDVGGLASGLSFYSFGEGRLESGSALYLARGGQPGRRCSSRLNGRDGLSSGLPLVEWGLISWATWAGP